MDDVEKCMDDDSSETKTEAEKAEYIDGGYKYIVHNHVVKN